MLSSLKNPTEEELLGICTTNPIILAKIRSLYTDIRGLKLDVSIHQRGTTPINLSSLSRDVLNDINIVVMFIRQKRIVKFIEDGNHQEMITMDPKIFEDNKKRAEALKTRLAKLDIVFPEFF